MGGARYNGSEGNRLDNLERAIGIPAASFREFLGSGDTFTGDELQEAIDYVYEKWGGGKILLPAGADFHFSNNDCTLRPFVTLEAPGVMAYGLTAGACPTTFWQKAGCTTILKGGGGVARVVGVEFAGLGVGTAGIGFGQGTAGGYAFERCLFKNINWGIGDETAVNGIQTRDCQFADVGYGIVNPTDARILDTNIRGARYGGISINTGGIHIQGGLIEFCRKGEGLDEPVPAISIISNANEVLISGVRFDRNAGNDIFMKYGNWEGGKRPRDITVSHCQFMRGAWGVGQARVAIYGEGVDRLAINGGNRFYAANSNPSLARGAISPRAAVMLVDCTGVKYRANDDTNLAKKIVLTEGLDPSSFALSAVWVESENGTDEWYLTEQYDPEGNPWVDQPSAVTLAESTVLSAGTIGALTGNTWAYGDNDDLGFSTIYVRLTAGGTPGLEDVAAYYDTAALRTQMNDSSISAITEDIETDVFRDAAKRTLAASASTTFTLKTRQRCPLYHGVAYMLRAFADQATSGAQSQAFLPFSLNRQTTTAVAWAARGTISPMEAGLTWNWTADSATGVHYAVTSNYIGDEIYVTVTNSTAYTVEITTELAW